MIGKEGRGFFAVHWDWLLSAVGVAAFAAGALWLAVESGVDPEAAAAEEARGLDAVANRAKPVAGVDMTLFGAAMKMLESPSSIAEPAESQGSFLASGKRVFCEQGDPSSEAKACGLPIPFGLRKCPFCGARQPEEQKVALDSDGDGISDELEVSLGLNPNDPSDASGDLDGDGFSNIEEIEARTDPADRSSHPEYLDSFRIGGPLESTKLALYFERVTTTSSTATRGVKFQFRNPLEKDDWGKPGKVYSVYAGEPIGRTGYIAKSYEQKKERVAIKGSNLKREVDRSVAIVERASDRKPVALPIGGRQPVDVDVQATLVYDREGGRTHVVVTGDVIDVHGEKISVIDIRRNGKTALVSLRNTVTGAEKTLSALEQ